MKVSSFDIFDTCLLRECGASENFFDVLSLRAFNNKVDELTRQEFVAARLYASWKIWTKKTTLRDIWDAFDWTHPMLKTKDELFLIEQETEQEMLVPVLEMRERVNRLRLKEHHIVFISDMYHSSSFLQDVLRQYGFYQDDDSLYVSCECGAEKQDASLFAYIKEKENLSYHEWKHYGDNRIGDYLMPKKLGIRATLINHNFTPYQELRVENGFTTGFKYAYILSGIGRALHYSTELTSHTDIVVDIIAPYYCSMVYKMLSDAERRGVKRLYFCTRDAYMMYKTALGYKNLFPSIECYLLYISSTALYKGNDDNKIAYYQSIGLATKEDYVGIVDTGSTGKTIVYLNRLLNKYGYKSVRGYYHQLFGARGMGEERYYADDVYCEINGRYNRDKFLQMCEGGHIWEKFFPLNTLAKTIKYSIKNGCPYPEYGDDSTDGTPEMFHYKIENAEYWQKIHEQLVGEFQLMYIAMGLTNYSDEIFKSSLELCLQFVKSPSRHYLPALFCMYGKHPNSDRWLPYIKKESWARLLITKGNDVYWKKGTLVYNHFEWFQTLYRNIRYGRV